MKNIKYIAIIALGLVACEPEIENSIHDAGAYSSGEADFSKFVAVGNSLTAGYADEALYILGQENSFPNILAGQFSFAGGGEFTQPLMNDNLGGMTLAGNIIAPNRRVLTGSSSADLAPSVLAGTPTTEVSNLLTGAFNNVGVPGAKSFHLVTPGYGDVNGILAGTANPYYARFASSSTARVIDDAVSQSPTFFSLWIGNNDILSFATSGGIGVDQTGNLDPSTYGANDITDPTVFAGVYSETLTALTATGAKGVVCNLPNVTDIPYFTTVPYAPLSPLDPSFGPQIPTLNGVFGQLNQVYAFLGVPERSIVFSQTEASAVVIKDESIANMAVQVTAVLNGSPTFPAFVQSLGLPAAAAPIVADLLGETYGQTRQANADDLLVLPSSSIIGTVNQDSVTSLMGQGIPEDLAVQFSAEGITHPLDNQWVLIPSEQTIISNAQTAYNSTISALAAADDNVILVDMKSSLNQLNIEGITYDAGTVTSIYATGGGFSLDGVHPTARGYAIIANIIIGEINNSFNATIPEVNVGTYPTVYVE